MKAHSYNTYLEYLKLDGEAWTGKHSAHFILTALIPELQAYAVVVKWGEYCMWRDLERFLLEGGTP